jgi:predicted O-methyltransferase YrrM
MLRLRRDPYPLLRRAARRLGYHLVRANYYSPVPDLERLPRSLWETPDAMPGVDLRLDESLALMRELAPLIAEYQPPRGPPGTSHGYQTANQPFPAVDAEILYAMVRRLEPRRIVEVGAGWSSLVIADAVEQNPRKPESHRIFDPFPAPQTARLPNSVEVARAEDISLDVFTSLDEGDLLFIDTTHTVRPGNDVLRLLLEVLPRLAPGVVVPIHDFFRPFEYPRFFFELGLFWQEHHLVQAFLAFNDEFEVLFTNHALWELRPDELAAAVPGWLDRGRGSSLWLRRALGGRLLESTER